MARLRTPAMMASMAIKARTEGMGVRATGRVLDKSHATIIRWEQRLAAQVGGNAEFGQNSTLRLKASS